MALEIERKFLVNNDSFISLASSSIQITQGYLSRDSDCVIRIRITDTQAVITIKGRNDGIIRSEFEYSIPMEDALELINLCKGTIIRKTRYFVPFSGFTWEVDRFQSPQPGLTIAEIELPKTDTSFPLPPFVGKEVSDDPSYFNSNL